MVDLNKFEAIEFLVFMFAGFKFAGSGWKRP